MRNFIAESFNSWQQTDNQGNPILYVNEYGELANSGERLATSRDIELAGQQAERDFLRVVGQIFSAINTML